MKEIIPTIVPTSFDDLAVRLNVVRGYARSLHIDAADGKFAPNTTWLPQSGERIPGLNALYIEAHLMLVDPMNIGVAFVKAGASRIIAHREAFPDMTAIIAAFDAWKMAGAQEVGLALKTETTPEAITDVATRCDVITLMNIAQIGQQGATFEPSSIDRVRNFHSAFPELTIAVDGGISDANIVQLAEAGASRFCVGSALSSSNDPAAVYKRLHELVDGL
jgi:ribulose-phosphate 3-epimerase